MFVSHQCCQSSGLAVTVHCAQDDRSIISRLNRGLVLDARDSTWEELAASQSRQCEETAQNPETEAIRR